MTTITVSSGWTLSGSTLYSGATSSAVSPSTGDVISVLSGGSATSVSLSADSMTVATGGKINAITVNGGGLLTTNLGVLMTNVTVANGGSAALSAGNSGTTTGNISGLTIQNGGSVTLAATANGATTGVSISSGGFLNLASGNVSALINAASGAEIEFSRWVSGGSATIGSSGISGGEKLSITSGTGVNSYADFANINGSAPTFAALTPISNHYVFEVLCFLEGTLIETETGERAIETIQPGNTVTVLRNGKAEPEAVKWVGYATIDLANHAQPEMAAPIRVKAGALGENTPKRDLVLSPEHCLILDGRCVPVKLLVNGGSIVREFPTAPITYYHIELENHGILLAEGAEAESYLDTGNRSNFDNADVPRLLHPNFEVNYTADRWATDACAPLAQVPDEVAPMWQSLAERSNNMGMTIPVPSLIDSPDLHLLVDGKRVQPTSDRNNRYVFMVPTGAKSVTLASRFCIPSDKMIPGVRDTRRLGVSVNWMAIRTSTTEIILPADHPALTSGWNSAERDGTTIWRWTTGAATIPWTNVEGPAVLTVRCTPVSAYPVYDEKLRLVA
jgi:antigen 43